MKSSRRRIFGPGLLVTAAFIGPGTVTTASLAGASFGFAIAWALLFAVLATIVLQEMSARLGLVTRRGLGEALRDTFADPLGRTITVILVVAAIAFGNAAFEMGNIAGAALGLEALTGTSYRLWVLLVGVAAAAILMTGVYRIIERLLIGLVLLMSVLFLTTAVIVRPDLSRMLHGMFVPSVPPGALLTVIALIGTTVVPYNLFLHASVVGEKWPTSVPLEWALGQVRWDTFLSVILGGLVTLAIMVTAAACYPIGTKLESAGTMARQLEPLLGPTAKAFFATGLLAAGVTSAITAPLAAAYATSGVLGWNAGLGSRKFRAVWATIIAIGTALALAGYHPVTAIIFAQAANGLLLPVVAIFLLLAVNRTKLLGRHTNGPVANVLGGAVVGTAAGLGIWKLINIYVRVRGG